MSVGKLVKGLQSTDAAKAAVAKIENAVRCEVITPDKLVRTPSSDLYDKSCYMNTEKFWEDNARQARAFESYCDQLKDFLSRSYDDYMKDRPKAIAKLEELKPYIDKMRKLQAYKDANL